ncbi:MULTISPECIES: hypothetical protein [unclassified Curtobacterium]|uniref:hypothetical protein n=1 Tax=unclassified Curtobacterium TaxID=257496 RepID=UPI00104EF752|nr:MULTISPECIES: hypothetical protein [unclassified Curtobacterium]MBF4587428.1 hypothetical protein [Curtobacterium sp. VKM Ac-2887]QSB23221.1 hypothetical protein JN350_18350 [Curtobacterium sp. 24E2]TCL78423.1 hypothetical protein EDF23_10446 [Curtobacterium sp. PhB128]TCL95184.1 hypothetical protein EDF29_10446 [Curtobacterium sp. PhB138]
MPVKHSRLRHMVSTGLAVSAVLLGTTCVVLVASGWPLSVAAGAAGLTASGFAGTVDPKSKAAPAAFLICVAAIGTALVVHQVVS